MEQTQRQATLELLADGQWHSAVELQAISFRYGARVHELRRDGHRIITRRVPYTRRRTVFEYRLEVGAIAPAPSVPVCSECEVGGGYHVEGCSRADGAKA